MSGLFNCASLARCSAVHQSSIELELSRGAATWLITIIAVAMRCASGDDSSVNIVQVFAVRLQQWQRWRAAEFCRCLDNVFVTLELLCTAVVAVAFDFKLTDCSELHDGVSLLQMPTYSVLHAIVLKLVGQACHWCCTAKHFSMLAARSLCGLCLWLVPTCSSGQCGQKHKLWQYEWRMTLCTGLRNGLCQFVAAMKHHARNSILLLTCNS